MNLSEKILSELLGEESQALVPKGREQDRQGQFPFSMDCELTADRHVGGDGTSGQS